MKTDAVLFDLDGTLLDTLDDLCCSLNGTLRDAGYPQRSREEIRQFIGNGVRHLVQKALPDDISDDPQTLESFLAAYLENYGHVENPKTAPYPGIPALLAELSRRQVPMAVVTNKPHHKARAVVESFFPGIFACIAGQHDGMPRKPAPDQAHAASKELGIPPADTLFVGDSEVDLLTGSNGGYTTGAVLWGFRTASELAPYHKDYSFSTPAEILEFLS
ncbi:MAG: HAD family hydrolase [Fibrobacterota bacterium]